MCMCGCLCIVHSGLDSYRPGPWRHRFIDQTGIDVESVFGGEFKDDSGGLKLKHDRKGLLSMANYVRAAAVSLALPLRSPNHSAVLCGDFGR